MNYKDRIQAVYEGVIPIHAVLEKHSIKPSKRVPSPMKERRNKDMAIYFEDNSFKDFYTGVGGDSVILDYYLTTGDELIVESGVDSQYFILKSKLLGIDIETKDKEVEVQTARFTPPPPSVEEALIQHPRAINVNFRAIFRYLWKIDREPLVQHFLDRGMTEEEIKNSPFVLAPIEKDINNILNIVNNQGTDTEGLPGFYRKNGAYTLRTFTNERNMMMIPIFNVRKELVSFHMRGLSRNSKYWSFSSAGEEMGCSPGSPTGFWGQFGQTDTIILTEGALKGYLAHIWTGIPTMYILGVSSQGGLHEALSHAKENGVKKVIIAFDMDYESNENVKESMIKAIATIRENGLRFSRPEWNPNFNGIDDFLLGLKKANLDRQWIEEKLLGAKFNQ